jgi:hypothetical protein
MIFCYILIFTGFFDVSLLIFIFVIMKIWTVTFNDGGWYSSRPEYQTVAETAQEAINKVLEENVQYKNGYDAWAVEFKIPGYVIEVYDERTYKREKNFKNLDI